MGWLAIVDYCRHACTQAPGTWHLTPASGRACMQPCAITSCNHQLPPRRLRDCTAQAAKTYLEKHFESFTGATVDELIRHGLKSLAGSLSDGELTSVNAAVAIVGKDMAFTVLENETIEPYITALKEEEAPMAVEAEAAAAGAEGGAAEQAAGEQPAAEAGEGGAAPMES